MEGSEWDGRCAYGGNEDRPVDAGCLRGTPAAQLGRTFDVAGYAMPQWDSFRRGGRRKPGMRGRSRQAAIPAVADVPICSTG